MILQHSRDQTPSPLPEVLGRQSCLKLSNEREGSHPKKIFEASWELAQLRMNGPIDFQ